MNVLKKQKLIKNQNKDKKYKIQKRADCHFMKNKMQKLK